MPLDKLKDNAGNLLRAIRASKLSPKGPGRIYTAGELEHIARTERTANGGVSVPASLQKNMQALRDKFDALKEKYPILPFEEGYGDLPGSTGN